MRIAFKAVIFSITLATCVRAQSPASEGARASFDVASIKPSPSNSGTFLNLGRGQLDARGITLKFLVAYAYGFFEFQILGTPSWADSERYHILAKSEDVERDDARDKLKLQTLLAERFQLKLHSSTKEGSVYSLVIDK